MFPPKDLHAPDATQYAGYHRQDGRVPGCKGFDVMFSSTDNRSFKQTNFPQFCASSCLPYLKSSYYEINIWSRPRSWPSSVASRPAGRPGSGRS